MANLDQICDYLADEFVVETCDYGSQITLGGNGNAYADWDVSKQGYRPIGILGINTDNDGTAQNWCFAWSFYIKDGTNVRLSYKNTGTSTAKVHPIVDVLYQKIGSGS